MELTGLNHNLQIEMFTGIMFKSHWTFIPIIWVHGNIATEVQSNEVCFYSFAGIARLLCCCFSGVKIKCFCFDLPLWLCVMQWFPCLEFPGGQSLGWRQQTWAHSWSGQEPSSKMSFSANGKRGKWNPRALGLTHTKWSMARTSTHTGASDEEENKVAHPSDSSRTCKARWLPAAAGKRPGSEWCFHWGHWEASTWGWSGTKSWMRRWGPVGRRVLGKHCRTGLQCEVMARSHIRFWTNYHFGGTRR